MKTETGCCAIESIRAMLKSPTDRVYFVNPTATQAWAVGESQTKRSFAEHELEYIILGKKNVFFIQMYLQKRTRINKYFHK